MQPYFKIIVLIGASIFSGCLFFGGDGEPENNGIANNGSTNNGATNNGTTNNGATNNGETNNGTTNNGTTNNGTTNNGTVLCGNGTIEPDEQCDGSEFGARTCATELDGTVGDLSCDSMCIINTEDCSTCGNGVVDAGLGEECDPSAPEPISTCADLNLGSQFTNVSPGCDQCKFIRSDCRERQISLGDQTACVLDPAEQKPLQCWGLNLGDRSATGITSILTPPDETEFTQISVGDRHICGVKSDNTIRCWGRNANEESGVDGFLHRVDADGTLLTQPNNESFIQVSAGIRYDSCGLKADGKVFCWGTNAKDIIVPKLGNKYVEAGFQSYFKNGTVVEKTRVCVLNSSDKIHCYGPGGSPSTSNTYSQFSLEDHTIARLGRTLRSIVGTQKIGHYFIPLPALLIRVSFKYQLEELTRTRFLAV